MKKCTFIFCITLLFTLYSHVAYAGSVSLSTIVPSTNISVNTEVSFQVVSEDLVRRTYTINDDFPGSTISNSSINIAGYFNWTPKEQDVGTHNLVITAVGPNNTRDTFTQTFVVKPPSAVSVKNISPGTTISLDDILSFGISASGYVNPVFSIYDSFSGGSISSRNVDSYGNVSWKPKDTDVGLHNLTIRVSAVGREDTVYQTIVVKGIVIKNISSTDIQTVQVGTPFMFTAVPYGLNSPSYTVGDSLRNNTIDTLTINGNSFSWTPQNQDVGLHTLYITGSDGTNVAKTQILIKVVGNSTTVNQSVSNTTNTTNTSDRTNLTTNTVSVSEKYIFKNTLSVGSKGVEVLELQKKLKKEGLYSGPINGSFGQLTKSAVVKYQGVHGISKLGIVGPSTRASLNKK